MLDPIERIDHRRHAAPDHQGDRMAEYLCQHAAPKLN